MTRDIIGISLGNNTSVAVINPGYGIKFALSEERLTGEKGTKKFPINALKEALKVTDYMGTLRIGLSSYEVIDNRTLKYFDLEELKLHEDIALTFYATLENYIRRKCRITENVRIEFTRVDHHTAHRLPAIYMSGYMETLKERPLVVITADGFGDRLSLTMMDYETKEIFAREPIETSLGLIYQYVTGALGFTEHRHEGKVTGLAAYGNPYYVKTFNERILDYNEETKQFIPNYLQTDTSYKPLDVSEMNPNINGFENMLRLKRAVYNLVDELEVDFGAQPQDIAASVQLFTENMLWALVTDKLIEGKYWKINLAVSGGIFANVRLNTMLKEIPAVNNFFALPASGDEGTAIGAAIQVAINSFGEDNINSFTFSQDDLYLGKVKGKELDLYDIDGSKYTIWENISINTLAQYLNNDKTIAFSIGNHEFGGRALGNHSIIAKASSKKIIDRLNVALDRNRFMPLAPFTIDVFGEDLFPGQLDGVKKTLKNMTLALEASTDFKDKYPAVVHFDNSVRIQILEQKDNPYIYKLMKEYAELTGEKVLINTSFNQHDKPIVFSDEDAYQAFVETELDMLVLDDKILRKKESK